MSNKNIKTQEKICLLHKIWILPKRFLYFIKLTLRYLLDIYLKVPLARQSQIQSTWYGYIMSWKNHLKTLQSVLNRFRLDIDDEEVIRRSEDILNHRFSILGQKFGNFGSKDKTSLDYAAIPWRYDPGSDFFWAKDEWYRYSKNNLPNGTDIKLPWELSRCQHFILLGEAYDKSRDELYAAEYRNQILDWIENNPVRYGPNWTVTMEVGIRIANWIVALLYFAKSRELNDVFLATLLKSASEHGKHIMANLENISLITSNHYLGNIAGLYILAVLCPVLKQSKKWETYAKKELEKEIFKQTFEEGWNFESSTAYQRLVTEMFLFPFLLAEYIKSPFSAKYADRLKKMVAVLGELAKPDGKVPQIGDNDNGRFLVFRADRDFKDLRIDYLLETANRNSRIAHKLNISNSLSFQQAGRYLFRSERIYFLVASGPKGQAGLGGHAHNDVLSFELNMDGVDIIVDSGTYCYTADPELRNLFRSVSRHNTLFWKGVEPCSLKKGLFMLPEEGKLKVETCEMETKEDYFSAVYRYKGRFHRRVIRFNKDENEIEVKDSCSQENALLSFVCAARNDPVIKNNGFYAGKAFFAFDSIKAINIEPSQYSSAFGVLESNKIVRVHLLGKFCSYKIKILAK